MVEGTVFVCVPRKADCAAAWVVVGLWDPLPPLHRAAVTGCAQELRCPDLGPTENHLRDEQVTTPIPSPQ